MSLLSSSSSSSSSKHGGIQASTITNLHINFPFSPSPNQFKWHFGVSPTPTTLNICNPPVLPRLFFSGELFPIKFINIQLIQFSGSTTARLHPFPSFWVVSSLVSEWSELVGCLVLKIRPHGIHMLLLIFYWEWYFYRPCHGITFDLSPPSSSSSFPTALLLLHKLQLQRRFISTWQLLQLL